MSLQQSSLETRAIFLKKFTKELIEVVYHQQKAKELAEKERLRIKQEIEIAKLKNKYIRDEVKEQLVQEKAIIKPIPVQQPQPVQRPIQPLLQRSMPIYTPPIQPPIQRPVQEDLKIDWGKIQALIDDPSISAIECQGDKKDLIVTKHNQIMKTEIKLNKEEIDYVINEFSDKARIPLIEGMLRARIGNLQISAVVSTVTSSRFIITKTQVQTLGDTRRIQLVPVQGERQMNLPQRQFIAPSNQFTPHPFPNMPPKQPQMQKVPIQQPVQPRIVPSIQQPTPAQQPVSVAQPPKLPELPQPPKINNNITEKKESYY